jgi:hypothetical protein
MIWAATASISIANFVPLMAELARDGHRQLSLLGPSRLAWQAQDLNPAGPAAMPPTPMPSAAASWSSTPPAF